MGKRVLCAVLWGILITFLGAFTAANVGENVIFTLLLYLLLVVSIFGVLILAKFSSMERARREPGAEHGEAKDKASEP